jgi:nitrogen fixation protein FixH
MIRRITGRHAAAALIAFFGVVIGVNVTMAMFAVRTFGGVVVENSYVASQKYNGWLEAARKQQQLGWAIVPRLDRQRHVIVSVDADGAEVTGFARHPLGREADVPLTFGRAQRSKQALPPGRWAVHLLVRRGDDEARLIEVLS